MKRVVLLGIVRDVVQEAHCCRLHRGKDLGKASGYASRSRRVSAQPAEHEAETQKEPGQKRCLGSHASRSFFEDYPGVSWPRAVFFSNSYGHGAQGEKALWEKD